MGTCHRSRRGHIMTITSPHGISLDALHGAQPTWRMDSSPIWDELVSKLGDPLTGKPSDNGREVIEGEVM